MKRLNFRYVLLLVWLVFMGARLDAVGNVCHSCQEDINPDGLSMLASYDGSFKASICNGCLYYAPKCWVCKLPALKKSRLHDDKRVFCDRDFAVGMFDGADAQGLMLHVTQDLERAMWRFQMKFPVQNVTVSLVSCASLYDVLRMPFNPRKAAVAGLTVTSCFDETGKEVKLTERHTLPAGSQIRYEHKVYVANGLPEIHSRGVLAHELAHVWLHENLPYDRFNVLDRDTIEGFCELVAYQLMDHETSPYGKLAIRNNLYTMGQQTILLEVDQGYGFERILRWFRNGTGRRLQHADLIREVDDKAPNQPVTVTSKSTIGAGKGVVIPAVENRPAILLSKTIVLKGVMFGKNKSALVNGVTFMQGDEQQVKLADGPVVVKCLEIKEASAVLSVGGETKEYFVGPPRN